jgi:plastocyanin
MSVLRLAALCVSLAWLWAPGPAGAAAVSIQVEDEDAAPAEGAVVALVPAVAAPAAAPVSMVIDQENETFLPGLAVVPVGSRIAFRNGDITRHHVFSFSPTRRFDFQLRPDEASEPIGFDRPGVVAVGCNIHDRMLAHVYVSDAPLTAVTGADGVARFEGVPDGAYAARAWHPRLRAGRRVEDAALRVGDASPAPRIRLPLAPARDQQPGRARQATD